MPPKRTTKKTTAGTSKAAATTDETTSPLKRKRAQPAKGKGKGKGKGKAPAEPTQTPPPSSSFNSAAEIVADQAQRSETDHVLSPAEAEEALDEVDEDEDDDEDAGFDLRTFIKGTLVDRRSGKKEKPVEEEEERTEEEKAAAALWDDSTLRKAFIPTSLPIGVRDGAGCWVKHGAFAHLGYLKEYLPAMNEEERAKMGDRCIVVIQHTGNEKTVKMGLVAFDSEDPEQMRRLATWNFQDTKITNKKFVSDAETRPPTPPPPAPQSDTVVDDVAKSPDEWDDMDRTTQVLHLRPHLQRILLEDYKPAQKRIDLFYDPRSRHQLSALSRCGDISDAEMNQVIVPELERWALREERFTQTRPEEQRECPRPTGSERYEALSADYRRMFVVDILLPEFVIALCIRCTEEVPADEQEAYLKACAELEELAAKDINKHWVYCASEMLGAREKAYAKYKVVSDRMGEVEKTALAAKQYDAILAEGKSVLSNSGRLVKRIVPPTPPKKQKKA